MSNIPKLRFPEFSGEWEEKKIIQFCEISAGGDIDKNNSQKEFSSSYPYSVYSNSLENKGLYGYANYYKIDSDVVTVTGRGDVGHAVARHEKFVPIVRLLVCKPKNNENVNFLENAINKTKIFIESTGVPQLTAPQLGNVKLFLPSLPEQQKIADFLSNVDSIITAETKILNTLQKKKKALMQKLFTQQLRFKSADGTDFPAWEEKKLGDVCNVLSGKRVPKGNKLTSVNTGLKYITVSDMGDKFVSNKDIKYITQEIETKIKKYKVITGDIIISVAGTLGKVNIITEEFNNANLTENCDKLTEFKGCITEYLYYFLQSDKFLDEINRIKTSSAQPKLALDRLRIFVIPVPIIEEQQKIADCLSSLDSLIQTQQKVVTTWQQRKKALLQQMFI